jgi:SAM-dependent methyltransferase
MRAVLFDLPHVAAGAAATFSRAGVTGRVRIESGDFFKELPSGADAIIMKHILHDWDDDSATRILQACHRALGPRGKVLIVDPVVLVRAVMRHSVSHIIWNYFAYVAVLAILSADLISHCNHRGHTEVAASSGNESIIRRLHAGQDCWRGQQPRRRRQAPWREVRRGRNPGRVSHRQSALCLFA